MSSGVGRELWNEEIFGSFAVSEQSFESVHADILPKKGGALKFFTQKLVQSENYCGKKKKIKAVIKIINHKRRKSAYLVFESRAVWQWRKGNNFLLELKA